MRRALATRVSYGGPTGERLLTPDQPTTVLEISTAALDKVRGFRDGAASAEDEALWIEVTETKDGQDTIGISLKPATGAGAQDHVEHHAEILVVVPGASLHKLQGVRIDWVESDGQAGFAVDVPAPPKLRELPTVPEPGAGGTTAPMAPSAPPAAPAQADLSMAPSAPPAAPAQADLSGELAQRLIVVLDEEVNPAIASHGGHVDLVAAEDDTAYLRMGGGCQGCGMASVTLTQGIEVAIRKAVPEVTRIVDVTDHAAGSNPYFEPAKK